MMPRYSRSCGSCCDASRLLWRVLAYVVRTIYWSDVHTHPPLIRDDRADVAFRNISTENLKYLNSQQAYVARLDPTRDISP